MSKKKLNILCPTFNEVGNIELLIQRVQSVFKEIKDKYTGEITFVDGGSTDGTMDTIEKLSKTNDDVNYIFFTRNFPHQNALLAGLHLLKTDIIITMDADLQQPPEDIPRFLEQYEKGYEIVNGVRKHYTKKISLKNLSSLLFYKMINRIGEIELEANSPDFRLYGSKVLAEIKKYNESDLFLRGYVSWLGFSNTSIEYEQADRHSGASSYTLSKMLRFAINGITSMSAKPLQWVSFAGIVLTSLPVIYMFYIIYQMIFRPETLVVGWLSIAMLLTFFQGISFLFLGIISSYLSQIYNETKKRPNYVIKTTNINSLC